MTERHYIGFNSSGVRILRNIRKHDTGEPMLFVDEGEAKKLVLDFSDWLSTDETIASATVTTENCTATVTTASPLVTLSITNAASYTYGRAILLVTSSAGEIVRQVIRIRRTNRYTDEQKYRDYT